MQRTVPTAAETELGVLSLSVTVPGGTGSRRVLETYVSDVAPALWSESG
ncbi:hypothetical protein [Streptomyces sp. NPDC003247]